MIVPVLASSWEPVDTITIPVDSKLSVPENTISAVLIGTGITTASFALKTNQDEEGERVIELLFWLSGVKKYNATTNTIEQAKIVIITARKTEGEDHLDIESNGI